MSYKIITDTPANIPSHTAKERDITVIPLSFFVDGEELTCTETESFNAKEFYDLMRQKKRITTSQIPPQRYIDCIEPMLASGEDILFIGISSGVSGSLNSARLAAKQLGEKYPERDIRILDSLGASLGEGLIVLRACNYRDEGKSLDEAMELLDNDVKHMYQIFTVDDLEYLHRGGRLSGAATLIGRLLGIRPMLKGNENGKIVTVDKLRSRRRVIEALAERYNKLVKDPAEQTVGISHADCPEDAQLLADLITAIKPPKSIITVEHEPATGSYLGPNSLALYFLGDEDVRLK